MTLSGRDAPPARAATSAVPEFAPDRTPCDFCEGIIPGERFGGEVTTAGGEVFRFMSVECLAGFLLAGRVASDELRSVRVVDYNHGERLIDARSARYLRSQFLTSPSGLGLLATETDRIAGNLHYFFGGERIDWEAVLELVGREWEL
jgi:hypothetical protein